jgi:hypothetical protein
LEDSPETYYVTDHYRGYPVVLVRLSRLDQEALHDLLSVSWRLTAIKGMKKQVDTKQTVGDFGILIWPTLAV